MCCFYSKANCIYINSWFYDYEVYEPIARQILENYIDSLPNLEIIASCKNTFEVLQILQEKSIDILFLDINMPKLSGLSLLKTIQQKPDVITTTAYPEYAIEGFELAVTDYLLKPFSLERFLQAVNKVQKTSEINTESISIVKAEKQRFIFVKNNKKIIKISFDEINYVEALAIIGQSCLGSVAVMFTLMNGNSFLEMFQLFIITCMCMTYNAAILSQQKAKWSFNILIASILSSIIIMIFNI
ncbi:hypothetical protein GCM10022393_25450 [Aquimarina addita]|uniref:Response regulatory domain-containing protein n=1 Tax=Aquimarina addita TaxID=870485 RepID=A0ABP6UNC2_9FLAO